MFPFKEKRQYLLNASTDSKNPYFIFKVENRKINDPYRVCIFQNK